jgi:hypothetical protein
MILDKELVLSRGPYAVDLGSYHRGTPEEETADGSAWCSVRAVWFRRKAGLLRACTGTLRDLLPPPADAVGFLNAMDDGRYGGDCLGRWDGTRYWGSQDPAEIGRHLALLRPMLERYPMAPDGYHGWWRFPTTREAQEARRGTAPR